MGGSFFGSQIFKIAAFALFIGSVVAIFLFAGGGGSLGGGDDVHVTMWTSGEKMTYLRDVVDEFNKADHKVPGTNKQVRVSAQVVNSGPQSDYLVARVRDGIDFPNGVPAPQIVSPSTDSWLTKVNYLTKTEVFDMETTKALALTPVVIAMYQEMAQALGWPNKEIGWSDIIDLANNPEGWGSVPGARAEWGKKPLLAWTDPSVSSTARSALFATYSAAAGKNADQLTTSEIGDPRVRQYVQNLQNAVDHYFPETLKLQAKLFDGPRYIQFVPIEEYNLVWLKDGLISDGSEVKPLDRRMVAIYPKEGTVWHNNPGGIVQNVPWSSEEQQAAAKVFVDYLLEPEQQQRSMDKGFRSANVNVPNGNKLSAEYGIDPTQPKKLLGTVDPAVAEEIVNNWTTVKKPSVVVIVLDASGSMEGDKLEQAKQGALAFLDEMAENNHVGMVTFSTGVNAKVDIGPIQRKKFEMVDAIERTEAVGSTALYDALRVAGQMVDSYQVQGQVIRGVVVLSDGANNAGQSRLCDIVLLQNQQEQPVPCTSTTMVTTKAMRGGGFGPAFNYQNRIPLFAIGYGTDADLETLRVLSEGTNGISGTADPSNVVRVLQVFGKYF